MELVRNHLDKKPSQSELARCVSINNVIRSVTKSQSLCNNFTQFKDFP